MKPNYVDPTYPAFERKEKLKSLGCIVLYFLAAVLFGLALSLLTGCSTASIMKQLKDDHATVRLRVTGWGSIIELDRSNPKQSTSVIKTP